jgi:hypothetical protein
MSQPFDIDPFPDLPPEVMKAFAAQSAGLEDLETAIAETQAQIVAVEEKIAARAANPDKAAPRDPRALRKSARSARAPAAYQARIKRVIEPDSIPCPCGRGNMVRTGEDGRGPDQAAGLYPCTLSGDPLAGSALRSSVTREASAFAPSMPVRKEEPGWFRPRLRRICWRAVGPDRCLQAFRTHAAEPAGCRHGVVWCAD